MLKLLLRIIPFMLLVLTFTTSSRAQLSAGLRGGVHFAHMGTQNTVPDYKTTTAPGFAVLFHYAVNPLFSIQVEPGYAQWSTRISETQTAPNYIRDYTSRIFLNYIEIPALLQYKPHLRKLRALFSFGPEARFLAKPMHAKTKVIQYYNGQITDQLETEERYTGDLGVRKWDIGLVAGAGVAYPAGSFTILAEGRYHYGFTDIYGHRSGNSSSIYVRGISAHAGFLVPIGKKQN
ncbi:porin family protein [Dyadobacter sediminis]|nr:porin family protein [Dyadobacter sediminis]